MGDPQGDPRRSVTVWGIGVTRVRPDGVIVGLTVQHRSDKAGDALSEAARKAQQLESLFREHGIDEEEWVAGSITLRERVEWDERSRREVRQGYEASSSVHVRLSDASGLGPLLARAADSLEASVDGPRWEILPENPAHDEARGRAIADARRRADAYARASGLAVGEVLAVVETGADQEARALRGSFSPTLSAASAAFEMPIHFEGLEVVAGVQVTYALVSR